jgi:enoyl-CoA hydratase/carnithine racemase
MVTGRAKISLNEITFGSSVFAGSVEMLRYCIGSRNAQTILFGGDMFGAEQAADLGLVQAVVSEDELIERATVKARELASRNVQAFVSIKGMLRNPVAEAMRAMEADSIDEFIHIWYSEETRESLKSVQIR